MVKNKVIIAIISVVFLLILFIMPAGAENITVKVESARKENIKEVRVVNGEIVPYKDIKLAAEISGVVEKLNVQMGQYVKKDEKLIVFDREQLLVQAEQAEAGLEAAAANLAKLKKGADEEQIEASLAGIKQAEASLERARAQLAMVKEGATEEELARAEASYQQAVSSYEGAKKALATMEKIYKDKNSLEQQKTSSEMQLKSAEKQWESAQNRFEQSQVNLEQAENNLEQTEKEYKRMKKLYEQNVVTEKQFDMAESQYKNAQLNVQNARSAVDSARIGMQQAKISYEGAQESYELAEESYNNPSQLQQQLDSARTQVEVSKNNKEIAKANLEKTKKGARAEEIESSLAGVKQAEAALESAKANHRKLKKGASSEEIQATKANVKQARASLKSARLRLEDSILTSPISGYIAAVNIDEGEMVNPGSPVVNIVSLDPVYVKADVSSQVIKNIKTGDKVKVDILDYRDKMKKGTVEMISPIKDQRSQSYPVKVKLDNQDHSLKGGMFADIYFTLAQAENSTVVSVDSVLNLDQDPHIFVVEAGKAVRRDIQVGLVDDEKVEVLAGVEPEEKVVIQGQSSIHDGDRIEVVD